MDPSLMQYLIEMDKYNLGSTVSSQIVKIPQILMDE